MIDDQREFVGQFEHANKAFLPDIINTNRTPYSGEPSNDVRPRSKSPYQGQTRNPYEFNYPRSDLFQKSNPSGRSSPIPRSNNPQYNQQCKKVIMFKMLNECYV